jgi:pimeloyl-ACP methyl ester carboxylesterase
MVVRGAVQPDAFLELQKSAYYDPTIVTPEVAEGYSRQLRVVGWDEALVKILGGGGLSGAPLTQDDVSSLRAPVLLLWGEQDTWVPLEQGRQLALALPGSEIITYPNVGHLPMEEAPAAFNEDLIAFLQRVFQQGVSS